MTFGAGGSSNCNRTIELAKKIKYEYQVEPVVHLTCLTYNKKEIDAFSEVLTKEGIENILAYPECHPESESRVSEIRHLKYKQDAGAKVLLSQLFFDNGLFFRFVEDCRIGGLTVPIIPGIMPVINAAQIKRMVTMCGASFPERFRKIIRKFEDNKEALFDAGMSYALSQIIDLLVSDIDGIHLYTMNNPAVAGKICEGIRNII